MRVLGIMSGTSLDGVDFALCDFKGKSICLERSWAARFPPMLRSQLHGAAIHALKTGEIARLHHDLGRFYARHSKRGLGNDSCDGVGVHGQTVFHDPTGPRAATFQIGEAAHIAEALRIPVVSNFRAADLAAGGQGAPLATLFHREVFARRGRCIAVNNLGGISNVTLLDWRDRTSALPHVLAFDTGPANLPIDTAVRSLSRGQLNFDRNGKLAKRGRIFPDVVDEWLRHPFFRQRPPKSTGREMFGESFWKSIRPRLVNRKASIEDTIATVTSFVARSIALNYMLHLRNPGHPPDEIILCGGGVANPVLVSEFSSAVGHILPGTAVTVCTTHGWPAQAIEPAAFAMLAFWRLQRRHANLQETTGARHPCFLGQISEVGWP